MTMRLWSTHIITCFYIVTWMCAGVHSSLVIDGDVIIAGLFTMQTAEGGDCGEVDVYSVLSMEAIRWYIDTVNTFSILPFTVGFRYYKTCENTDVSREHAVDILKRYQLSKSTNATQDFIVGVIGPELSSESTAVSSVFSSQPLSNRFLQISYSSTSIVLNQRQTYRNFYRVIPDDSVQIKAMVKLMLELEWNRVSILFENDTYGQVGAEDLQRLSLENNICVSRIDPINIDSSRRVDVNDVKGILEDIIFQSPQITGVVYFGSMTVANMIFRILEKQDYNNVPIFLLSESIQLQNTVFHSTAGTELFKPRGAMTVSAPMLNTSITNEFWNNISSVLTDSQALSNAFKLNPHLTQLVSRYNNRCSVNSSKCQPLTESEVNNMISDRSPYVDYALLAATTMVEALRKTYSTICSGACLNINDFKKEFQPTDMLDIMDGLSVSFNNMNGVFIGSTPNMQLTSATSVYDVYNYRTKVDDNSIFQFVHVGYLSEDDILLQRDVLRDYDAAAKELEYPDLRRGTCPKKEKCEECIRNDLKDSFFHIPGDFYVVGIVSINNKAIPGPLGCGEVRTRHGYQMLSSLKFGLEEFKTRSSYAQYKGWFGNNTIGLIVINSCNNELEIVRRILDLHSNGLPLQDGTSIDLTDRILGYIGGQSSDVSEPAAIQLTKLNIVQISYSSTNPVLSNKELYPYFMRIITPDKVQSKAILAVVKALNGRYVQLIYSEGAYGEGGRDAVVKEAKKNFVCIAQEIKVNESDTYYDYYEMMRKKPHAKIAIIYLRSHVVHPFMRDVKISGMEPGEFQFVGSEAWGNNADVLNYDITKGALAVSIEMDKYLDLEEYLQGEEPDFLKPNPWLMEYIQNRQDCYFRWSFDKSFSRLCTSDILPRSDLEFESDPWCIFVFNTLLSFLKGSATFLKDRCGTSVSDKLCSNYVHSPRDLVQVLQKVKMDIYGDGDIFIYDQQGDGLMGYKIYNIQDRDDDKSKSVYSQVGSYSLTTGLLFDTREVRYPTLNPIVSSCPSESACLGCQEKSTETVIETKSENDVTVLILAGIIGLCGVIILLLIFVIIRCIKIRPPKHDTYITPQQLEERQSADGNYHSGHNYELNEMPQHYEGRL